MVERYANRFDAVSLTFVEVAAACLVFLVIAVAGLPIRRQRAGCLWLAGCAAIFAGILIAEPLAAATPKRAVMGSIRSAP
jgi:hypothetical protein